MTGRSDLSASNSHAIHQSGRNLVDSTKHGCTKGTLRQSPLKAEQDGVKRPSVTRGESDWIAALERENRKLNRSGAILHMASALSQRPSSTVCALVYAFSDEERAECCVEPSCHLPAIASFGDCTYHSRLLAYVDKTFCWQGDGIERSHGKVSACYSGRPPVRRSAGGVQTFERPYPEHVQVVSLRLGDHCCALASLLNVLKPSSVILPPMKRGSVPFLVEIQAVPG